MDSNANALQDILANSHFVFFFKEQYVVCFCANIQGRKESNHDTQLTQELLSNDLCMCACVCVWEATNPNEHQRYEMTSPTLPVYAIVDTFRGMYSFIANTHTHSLAMPERPLFGYCCDACEISPNENAKQTNSNWLCMTI